VPVPPKARTITAFAGSYIRLRDYQTPPGITCPELSRRNPHGPPSKKDEGREREKDG